MAVLFTRNPAHSSEPLTAVVEMIMHHPHRFDVTGVLAQLLLGIIHCDGANAWLTLR